MRPETSFSWLLCRPRNLLAFEIDLRHNATIFVNFFDSRLPTAAQGKVRWWHDASSTSLRSQGLLSLVRVMVMNNRSSREAWPRYYYFRKLPWKISRRPSAPSESDASLLGSSETDPYPARAPSLMRYSTLTKRLGMIFGRVERGGLFVHDNTEQSCWSVTTWVSVWLAKRPRALPTLDV